MNREEITNTVGLIAGIALVVLLVAAWFLQRPITDRTLVIFAVLLWGTLQLDISAALPVSIITQPADNEDDGE